jgi:beta-galactosidase/beta-glucuronidase
MGYTADDSDIQQGKESRSRKKIFIIGGVVFIVFIVLVLILPRGNNMIFNSQLNSINTRLTQFEEKLTVFENMKERVSLLEKQQKVLQQLVLETGRSARSAKSEIDRLAEKIEILEKKKVSSAGKTGKSRASKQQREQTSSTKKRYHIIRKGENLYRISLRYGIPVEKLCRLNGITSGQVIVPGKKLLVPPGKNQ